MNATPRSERTEHLLRHVRVSHGEQEWEFPCECGKESCHEYVFLTLDAYAALHDDGRAVLADGHRLSQVERARRLGAEAEALRRQAEHQLSRATKNMREWLRIPRPGHRRD
jgi:hypothetical protein